MKTNRILQYLSMASCAVMFAFVTGCEGPQGPAGADGTDGTDGTNGTNGADANETCKLCHNPESVDLIAVQFQFSKHEYGEAAFEESGNTGCTPCHAQEAFKYMVSENVPATYSIKAPSTRYSTDYVASPSSAYGELGCSTCHSSIHDTYTAADIPSLTTVAPVPMVMWAGAKTIDLTQDGGISNLCVKCHQPRPFSKSSDGNVLDYDDLKANPAAVFTQMTSLSYRTHSHYGGIGAIFAGKGGVEFSGTVQYGNSEHTTLASCQDCHMAPMTGKSGGHTFFAAGNFNGCNVTSCHGATGKTPMSSSNQDFKDAQTAIKTKLDALATKLTIGGIGILNKNPDSEANLWAGKTAGNYDGYLNVYDPVNNPNCVENNGGTGKQFKNSSTGSFTQAQKDYNATLPTLSVTNAQMGAIINFQLCLREFSLGVHNTDYSRALLDNSIAILP